MEYVNGLRVTRTQVPLRDSLDHEDDRHSEGDQAIRVYYSPDDDLMPAPSVTTIKDLRVDPEKSDALEGWRSHFDGKSAYARPWWKDQQEYKGHRGTLVHFSILSAVGEVLANGEITAAGDTYYHQVGEDNWGREEYESEYALKKWSKNAPSARSKQLSFQPRDNQYDGEHAWDRAVREMKWANRAFKERMIDGDVTSVYERHQNDSPVYGRLADATILGLEEFVYNVEYGYGGQYDLLYETADGTVVLSDLKTSSGVRFDHKLQGAAYKLAVESATDYEIDETEVIRVYPDDEVVEVSRSSQWDRTLEGLGHQFLGLTDASRVEYQQTIQEAAKELDSRYKEEVPADD
jgi:hypothetical protein